MKIPTAICFFEVFFFLLPAGLLAVGGFRPVQDSPIRCKQEIVGRVFLVSGNRMPAPGKPRPVNKGVRATVLIYELTNSSQTIRQGQSPYYSLIRTRLVKELETDEKGNFTACVPAGLYSVFIKKGNLFYANRFDTHNNIAPVRVLPGIPSVVDCPLEGGALSW